MPTSRAADKGASFPTDPAASELEESCWTTKESLSGRQVYTSDAVAGRCQKTAQSYISYTLKKEKIMLGEQIGELRGKRTARRVLSTNGGFKVEVSFEDSGKLLGSDVNNIGTYSAAPRPDGSLYGEGQGVVQTKDGELATWKGQGVGRFVGGGAVSYRGAVYYSTASAKLARLNTVAAIFEYEVDTNGNTSTKLWEWR